ncbi:GNAT family N-acetyltransferase [Rhodovulum adriaticum]|uniref:RimJ/RimL family protein N-acetyltransferase n=1 Tax=Rhodovulum adriaticum TaxID=35804 RepID=A0A4V2SM97_RHOAD|nr:GNAT family protein [Rhodovulum adriaticum]MBK1636401.1 GNAT family N-acetyltransferase [Rhodovulum adriaticum]TCP26456.1 RimJ/RimL family protein N-acetyltransferase [Rhodovulum adriaticum]
MPPSLPIGPAVPGWTAPPIPPHDVLQGRYTRLEPLQAARHGDDLFRACHADDSIWTYLPYGPFGSAAAHRDWIAQATAGSDPQFYAICPAEGGAALGVLSYLRIQPAAGSIEIGHVCFSPALQRTRIATEAVTLLIARAFQAGYRRVEWKCNALNLASRRAAQRLGFSYEGVFRQQAVVKGRNRDTAWFAAIDAEWPALQAAHDRWLSPSNFDDQGRQIARLGDLTAPIRVASDPALG